MLKHLFILGAFLPLSAFAATTTYFSCPVKEKLHGKNNIVTVKFAVEGLDFHPDKGQLVSYPGIDEEEGNPIFVEAQTGNFDDTMMWNLNAQGGDMTINRGTITLFGDGDGYQYTDLVLWDVDQAIVDGKTTVGGYVRDYGSAHEGGEEFKQFITCEFSDKKL